MALSVPVCLPYVCTWSEENTRSRDYPPKSPICLGVDDKKARRMRRNRESAAASRDRRKTYIEELEGKVRDLEDMAAALRSDNLALKRKCGDLSPLDQFDSPVPKRCHIEAPTTPRAALASTENTTENTDPADALLLFSEVCR